MSTFEIIASIILAALIFICLRWGRKLFGPRQYTWEDFISHPHWFEIRYVRFSGYVTGKEVCHSCAFKDDCANRQISCGSYWIFINHGKQIYSIMLPYFVNVRRKHRHSTYIVTDYETSGLDSFKSNKK